MRSMQPRTRILGIKITEEINEKTGLLEKFFVKPAPESYGIHWKNRAWKDRVQADPTAYTDKMEQAFYRVPRYAGIDNKLLKYLISCQKYAAKLDRRKNGIPEQPYVAPGDLTFAGGTWIPSRFVS